MAELDLDQIIDARRSRWRRWRLPALAAIVAVVAAGSYLAFFSGGGGTPVAAPQQAKATVGALATTLTIPGTAATDQSSILTFAASGVVTQVLVRVGDRVQAGQPLARLDDRDAQRRYASAQLSLQQAQTRLEQLLAPPNATDATAAFQAVQSARVQLMSAQMTYKNLFQPLSDADIAAADAALAQAKNGWLSALSQVDSAKLSLVSAQDSYCFTPGLPLGVCAAADLPLAQYAVDTLNSAVQRHVLTTTGASRVVAFLQANSSYLGALNSRDSAAASLRSAQAKRDSLGQPPLDIDVQQARNAIDSAQATLDSAVARQQALGSPTATDVALQQQSVASAQIGLQQAQDALDDLTLKAPFAGTAGAVTLFAGQRNGSGSVVLTNPDAIRVDLTVSETDLSGLKPGVLGVARFDSLPGSTYVVRIMGVSPAPAVTQGVVTYPVQAAILRGEALTAVRDQLPALLRTVGGPSGAQLAAVFGGQAGAAGGASTGGASTGATPGGTAGAGQNGRASGTPGAAGGGTAGAGPSGRAGGGAAGAAGVAQALLNPTLPAAGMNASITLLLSVTENQLLVPSGAVRRQGGQRFVYLPGEAGGEPVQRQVVVAGSDGTNTAITSGLNEGDTVLLGAIGTATPTAVRTVTGAVGGGAPGGPGGPGGGGIR
ncbi:MAG: HlyD family efflux transporter periplasmic adaptor subunit [Dehalococcoidia bacterium]|nr:HlyD family efflux transporter periplasmic adaptor subunit [Dehalococcoidia bacterium]